MNVAKPIFSAERISNFAVRMKANLIDSHAHLYLKDFNEDIGDVIDRALSCGVSKMFLPNIDLSTIDALMEICKKHKGICFPMMGLHPTSVKENYHEELDKIYKKLEQEEFIAIGEIGIDLYWDKTYLKEQQIAFEQQIQWAKKMKLPVVIHARDSFDEIFEILDSENTPELSGVFHSFTGNVEQVKKILSYDFYIGLNGIVTFKNSELASVAKTIPLQNLLIETDSPFLAPVPYRGKRNESSYVIEVARKLAIVFNLDLEQMAELTSQNALRLFKRAN
jgi:TatD DNase family protein